MFDEETKKLISNAPSLEGLDLSELPRILTEAYAKIVSARLALSSVSDSYSEDMSALVSQIAIIKRIAYTNEAFVSTLDDRENRSSAAFVAGAAHQVILQFEKFKSINHKKSFLNINAISPDISATLLFLIAEATSDAAEVTKLIHIENSDPIERFLLESIRNLAQGKLQTIIQEPLPDLWTNQDYNEQASKALYWRIAKGIKVLANQLLNKTELPTITSENIFREVINLCKEGIEFEQNKIFYSIYSGPHHLATLLLAVQKDLIQSAIINIPSPLDTNAQEWALQMEHIALTRPFLWRNHRKAIESGYLEKGKSAVISFPTGAGKSTLSELKIARSILNNEKIIFLAPTLALVDQVVQSLEKAFPTTEISREIFDNGDLDFIETTLELINVMTPERCLTLISFNKESFKDIGLLVFDECHLIHSQELESSRRAVDAMLCVLNFTSIVPDADLLFLSAMIKNTIDIANWISELTQRSCIPLELMWKPTRQIRGCVVYQQQEINSLNLTLSNIRVNTKISQKSFPTNRNADIKAEPYGFFCLEQTWLSTNRQDYSLLPLTGNKTLLNVGNSNSTREWYLTPNVNSVSTSIAISTAKQNLKTIVFMAKIDDTVRQCKQVNDHLGYHSYILTDEEQAQYDKLLLECGGEAYTYLEIRQNQLPASMCHHGLLLPLERSLIEKFYKKDNKINILFATTTVSQGINFPSEIVIISGDKRFDSITNKLQQQEAYEILNAAGRAGRAGESSHGFVLLVPSRIVSFNSGTNEIDQYWWRNLKTIFAQSDQCLDIQDPLTLLIDQIHVQSNPELFSGITNYFIERLPSLNSEATITIDNLLNKSLAAYHARKRDNNNHWLESKLDSIIIAKKNKNQETEIPKWAEHISSSIGVSVTVLIDLYSSIKENLKSIKNYSTQELLAWYEEWLSQRLYLLKDLFRPEVWNGLFRDQTVDLDIINREIFDPLHQWMQGKNLLEMEQIRGIKEDRSASTYCKTSRLFILRIVPQLAYIFELPATLFKLMIKEDNLNISIPINIQMLGSNVRLGMDLPEKVVISRLLKNLSRIEVHQLYQRVYSSLDADNSYTTINALYKRVSAAIDSINENN